MDVVVQGDPAARRSTVSPDIAYAASRRRVLLSMQSSAVHKSHLQALRRVPLADRILVALLRLQRLPREPRAAPALRTFLLLVRFRPRLGGRCLAQAPERCLDVGGAEYSPGCLPLLVVEEAGQPEQQRIGEPEGDAAGEPTGPGGRQQELSSQDEEGGETHRL